MFVSMSVALLCATIAGASAQFRLPRDRSPYPVEFEDGQVRVHRIILAAHQKGATLTHAGGVLVLFTADLAGRMPAAEAQWQPAGPYEPENLGAARFEAILVELKTAPLAMAPALPPEVNASSDGTTVDPMRLAAHYPGDRVQVSRLVDDSNVLVVKERFPPTTRVDLLHFHAQDSVRVYLRRGDVVGATGRVGMRGVRRGQFDVLPPNTLHAFSNAGSDPIEFIAVYPK